MEANGQRSAGPEPARLHAGVDRLRRLPPPLSIFLWSRIVIWAAALYAWMWVLPRAPNPPNSADLGYATQVWSRWDSGWFVPIAQHGYHSATDGAAAFYPLYPLAIGLVGRAFGGYYVSAGIVVSLGCCLGAFFLLHRLALRRLDADGARRAVLYLAIFPMSLFLQAVYGESLFLVCCLGAFALAEERRWLPCGLVAGLAMLARLTGFALLPALALIAWRAPERKRALASLVAAPALFSLYPLWLHWKTGDAFAFARSEEIWHRHLSAAGPFGGLWQGARSAWAGLEQVVTGNMTHVYWSGGQGSDALHGAALNLEDFGFTLLFLVLAVVAWRRYGAPYGLFAVLCLAIPLSVPSNRWPLQSMPRFCLVVFPAFLVLAEWGATRRRDRIIVATSAVLLGVAIVEWSITQWVS